MRAGLLAAALAAAPSALPGAVDARARDLAADCLEAPRTQAVAPCERALSAAPSDRALLRQLAWAYLAVYRQSEGIDLLRDLAARTPQDPQAHFDLAAAQAGLRMFDPAISALRTAIRLRPGHLPSYRLAALLYEATQDHARAFDMHLRLALAGARVGMFDLAEDFALGRGTAPDQRRAREWYGRAAEAGHVLAMRLLAEKLAHGAFGTPPEPELADHWRARARAASALPELP